NVDLLVVFDYILFIFLFFFFFFLQADDGLRDQGRWLGFSLVLFRSGGGGGGWVKIMDLCMDR
ncbi:hypothetical protein, partial [Escherichia coli]|uniref:hypothetical protein n=1 Tax=Escherichia coli TaxID=562 RepID=UPI001BFC637B